jgi:hypothetical protein
MRWVNSFPIQDSRFTLLVVLSKRVANKVAPAPARYLGSATGISESDYASKPRRMGWKY